MLSVLNYTIGAFYVFKQMELCMPPVSLVDLIKTRGVALVDGTRIFIMDKVKYRLFENGEVSTQKASPLEITFYETLIGKA